MSFKALDWARSVKTGSPTLKAVLRAIAEYADAEGVAWPSQERLIADTEFSERAVRNAILSLEKDGALTREERRRPDGSRSSDRLILNLAWIGKRHEVPVDGEAGDKQPARGAGTTGTSCRSNRHVVPDQPAAGAPLTTFEPPENLQKEPSNEPESRAGSWPEDFWEQFQAAYPNLVRLRSTLRLLREIQAEGMTRFEEILDGITRYVATKPADRNWLGSDKFLEDHRFEDRPAPLAAASRQPPLTGQAARLAQLASQFQGGSDVASGTQPSQRRAYGTRGSYGGGQPVQWTSGDDARPTAEVLLIADRRAYGGRA